MPRHSNENGKQALAWINNFAKQYRAEHSTTTWRHAVKMASEEYNHVVKGKPRKVRGRRIAKRTGRGKKKTRASKTVSTKKVKKTKTVNVPVEVSVEVEKT